MSEVNVRLKHNFEDSDKLFRILFAAIKIGKPASKRKIADVADISSQLVDYHIDKLVDNGQHFLDIRTKALAQADDDANNLQVKWEGLQAEHRARKR